MEHSLPREKENEREREEEEENQEKKRSAAGKPGLTEDSYPNNNVN